MLSFHHATTIADWGDIFVEGKVVFEGHSTVELRVHEGVKNTSWVSRGRGYSRKTPLRAQGGNSRVSQPTR
jgi:hypothetical protein